jgi:hypothetical protein
MKLANTRSTVISNGEIGEASSFSIASNSKMFRVLSDTLYKDKIGSLVREISCNAYDAHRMAKKPDEPFTIHMPNKIEPWFAVKDEGVGLSHNDVKSIYTTYGKSTKDGTNEFIGAFGLGSKTPFAYTDQFTIISIHGGIKSTYVAIMEENGVPDLRLMHTEETTEHAGMEISIGVEAHDFPDFENAIQKQLQFFKVKPTLINNLRNLEFKDMNTGFSISTDEITVFNNSRHDPVQGLWVVQGDVGYEIDTGLLKIDRDKDRNLDDFISSLYSQNAYFTMPIGTVGVTANREGVSYDKETIKAIKEKFGELIKVLCKDTLKTLKNTKYLWDRAASFNSLMGYIKQSVIHNSPSDMFKGATKLSNDYCIDLTKLYKLGCNVHEFTKRQSWRRSKTWRLEITKLSARDNRAKFKYRSPYDLFPSKDIVIVVKDTKKVYKARLRKYMEENDFPTVVFVSGDGVAGGGECVPEKCNILKIAKALYVSPTKVKLLSSFPVPEKTSRGGIPTGKRPRAYIFSKGNETRKSTYWTGTVDEIDDIGEAIYMPMERHCLETEFWNQDNAAVFDLFKRGEITTPIIAVNMQTTKRIQKGDIGQDLITPSQALVPFKAKLKALESTFKRYVYLNRYLYVFTSDTFVQICAKKESIMKVIKEKTVLRIDKLKNRRSELLLALKNKENDLMMSTITNDLEEKATEHARRDIDFLDRKFPMLQHIGGYHYVDDQIEQDVIDYIEMVYKSLAS